MLKFVCLFGVFAVCAAKSVLDNERIVGGQLAVEGQFPYQVSVRNWDMHDCGGSIINKQWILTAAHCTNGRPLPGLAVRVGSTYSGRGARYFAIKVVQHEKFNVKTLVYDIALIKVDVPIKLVPGSVSIIELNTADIGSGAEVTLSGWGFTSYPGGVVDQLRFIKLKSVSNALCSSETAETPFPVEAFNICTFTKTGEGFCKGDSGGPLVYNGKVAGIVSWNKYCAVGMPDVYTRVSSFVPWIQDSIANN